MALPSPTVTWKFLRFLIREAPFVVPAAVAYLEGVLDGNESVPDLAWMRWICEFSRSSPTGTTEDRGQFKMDIVNITSGAIDSTWTTGDFTNVQAEFDNLITNIKAHVNPAWTFVGHKAYKMRYNDADPGPGARSKAAGWAFNPTGPPVWQTAVTTPMTGTAGGMPYQVAGSVTFRTGWPRHWGRIYLPTPPAADFDANGRLTITYRTAVANAVRLVATGLASKDFLHVVAMTDLNKTPFHALLGVTQYQVDDIPDVQRRRRPRTAAARTIGA